MLRADHGLWPACVLVRGPSQRARATRARAAGWSSISMRARSLPLRAWGAVGQSRPTSHEIARDCGRLRTWRWTTVHLNSSLVPCFLGACFLVVLAFWSLSLVLVFCSLVLGPWSLGNSVLLGLCLSHFCRTPQLEAHSSNHCGETLCPPALNPNQTSASPVLAFTQHVVAPHLVAIHTHTHIHCNNHNHDHNQ